MKSEKPFSREEIIREFISEVIEEVTVELGVNGTKRQPKEPMAQEVVERKRSASVV